MRSILILMLAPLLIAAVPKAPNTEGAWDCKFTARTVCGADGSCRPGKGTTWIYLTPSQNSYWRCNGSNFDDCDQYRTFVTTSGAFRLFELAGHASFAKVGPGLEVTEVLSLMHAVYINRGKCIEGPPPLIRTDRP